MKKSKASNLDDGFDFISNMPDPILELILQGLPTTEEVLRTSILSTRWRYLWTSLPQFPSLNIDCERALNPSVMFPKKKFKDFVSWCLADKTRDLDSLRLCYAAYYKVSTVEAWIKAAVMRKVKSLDLMYCPKSENGDITLPYYVISCDSLEVLKLRLYRFPFNFPDSTSLRFRALRVLELESVYCFHTDLVEQFLQLCPLLEELTLIDCYVKVADTICVSSPNLKTLIIRNCKDMLSKYNDLWSNVNVSCPELVSFEFVGRRGEIMIEEADSLKKAVIFPEVISERTLSHNLGHLFCDLLAKISHVVSLSINLYFIQCIDIVRDEEDNYFYALFPNLKTLEVTTTTDAFTMNVIINFLICARKLESLNLTIQEKYLGKKYWVLADVGTRRILTRHLKRVKFTGFTGKMQKLAIARHILEHGNALEEMVFSWGSEVKYREKSTNIMNMLLKFYKASSNVKLISILGD